MFLFNIFFVIQLDRAKKVLILPVLSPGGSTPNTLSARNRMHVGQLIKDYLLFIQVYHNYFQ